MKRSNFSNIFLILSAVFLVGTSLRYYIRYHDICSLLTTIIEGEKNFEKYGELRTVFFQSRDEVLGECERDYLPWYRVATSYYSGRQDFEGGVVLTEEGDIRINERYEDIPSVDKFLLRMAERNKGIDLIFAVGTAEPENKDKGVSPIK